MDFDWMRFRIWSSVKDSNCENLPETHAILREIRSYVDSNTKIECY